MYLDEKKSICEIKQHIIVSKENKRVHRAINADRSDVYHYHLDGDIFSETTTCDYLLLNETKKHAYFIELKGQDYKHAIEQIKASHRRLKSELSIYTDFFYRIITSKSPTLDLKKSAERKLEREYGGHLQIKTRELEENI